jgi:hypothetical protein
LDVATESRLFEGRFGRMFRGLPVHEHDEAFLRGLADGMNKPSADNPKIPSGFTYLGQFIDHDLTFDPVSSFQRDNDPDALVSFRSPRFDLDSVYGRGPDDDPFMYNQGRPAGVERPALSLDEPEGAKADCKFLIGRIADDDGTAAVGFGEGDDLPRGAQGRAIIGDPRNDENTLVSQLHHAFVRFHNNVVEHVAATSPSLEGAALFEEARRVVTWHYQWVVVHDFLPRIAGREIAEEVLPVGGPAALEHYRPRDAPFIPVEFSGAAYRFGHSMVRAAYDLNEQIRGVPLFSAAPGAERDHFGHLNGFRPLPVGWTVDWRHLAEIDGSRPQPSREIDTHLAPPLLRLPTGVSATHRGLPELNLLRGRALQLPSGQAVAERLGVTPVGDLGLARFDLDRAHRRALEAETPLWYYVLREAENPPRSGRRLGPVGGRIVAEVLVGLLAHDPQGFLRRRPTWRPEGLRARTPGHFTLADLLRFGTIGQ